MSNLLQMDAFAKNSLNRLSTEIKEMIVAMVELQDVAYETRQRTRVGYGGMLADLSRVEFSDERDVENLVGEEYAVAVKGSAAMGDERRKWRRLLGKGTSSVFRVNREFAALAAPHLFKTFFSSAFANQQRADRGLLPQFRIHHFKTVDLGVEQPSRHDFSYQDALASDIATRLSSARRLILDYRSTTVFDHRPGQLLTNEQYVLEKMVVMAKRCDSLVLQEMPADRYRRITQLFAGIASLDLQVDEDDIDAGIFTVLTHVLSALPCLRELRFAGSVWMEKDLMWRTEDSTDEPEWTGEAHLAAVAKLSDLPLERLSWRMYEPEISDIDFIHSFAKTLRFLDLGIDSTSTVLEFVNKDSIVFSFPLLTTLKISGSSPTKCACRYLPEMLSVFAASPLSHLNINHFVLVDALHRTAFVESLRSWLKTLKSLTLDSPNPYRHSTHLPRLEAFSEEFKIRRVLRGDYMVDWLDFDRDGEEGDVEVREVAPLDSKLSGLLELAMGENDRALAMGDDRGLFELWNDCGGLIDQERFIEMQE